MPLVVANSHSPGLREFSASRETRRASPRKVARLCFAPRKNVLMNGLLQHEI